MSEILAQTFWYGILVTPVIAFFCVRKFKGGLGHKILSGIAVTLVLATLFFYLAGIINFLGHGI